MPSSTSALLLTLRTVERRPSDAGPPFLQRLMTEGSLCHSRHELCDFAAVMAREFFRGVASAVMLIDSGGRMALQAISGIASRELSSGDEVERPHDPVLAAVLDRQVAVHSGQLSTPDAAASAPISGGFARAVGVFHYLAAPLYGGRGTVVGVVGVCRRATRPPFERGDIRWVTALAGHLSVALARLPQSGGAAPASSLLTARERQVAALVMQGANNVHIALTLRIARDTVKKTLQRMYEKLHVHGRAEMVTKLLAGAHPQALDPAPSEVG